jgi:ATP-dependent protease ClpP protease subunit
MNSPFIMPENPNASQVVQESQSIRYYKQTIPVSIHHFYITDEIGDIEKYLDMIHTLKVAEEHDTVFIYLNTPGGNLTTTIHIINAMRQSNATVITCIESEVCSAGTMIFLAGDRHVINDNCTFMIHNYSHGVIGKGHEVISKVKYTEKFFRKFAKDIYGNFLTQEELENVINGGDIWMDSEEVKSRLKEFVLENGEQDVVVECLPSCNPNNKEVKEVVENLELVPKRKEKSKTKK